jgi:hypothetical protein
MSKIIVGTATVTREIEVVAHRYETASAYDRLLLTPGTYDLYTDPRQPLVYVYRALVACTRLEHVYFGRLFMATYVDRKTEPVADTYGISLYDYQLAKGPVTLHDGAVVVESLPDYRRWSDSPEARAIASRTYVG